jgi:hypothetical protein
MTEKRLLWWLGGVTALVLVVALAVYLVRGLEDRVTPENCDRIKVGMTEREVRAILGRPADHTESAGQVLIWVGEHWVISVDLNGPEPAIQVVDKHCEDVNRVAWCGVQKPSVWQKLRGLLPW